MTAAAMSAVYTALSAALAIPVTRSWPQGTPALPGCTFRLLSWRRGGDGTNVLSFLVLLRVTKLEDGDDYTEDAQLAMRGLGYVITAASDELDEVSGFFVRSLTFEGLEAATLLKPAAAAGFVIAVDGGGGFTYLPDPAAFTLVPASREPVINTRPSFSGPRLPALALERVQPARLVLRSPFHLTYPAIGVLRAAFLSGAVIQARAALRDPANPSVLDVQVIAFHASALGTHATLLILDI